MQEKWWMKENIYQIYMRSFYDKNGDGIGDLDGISDRLDYISSLGIGVIWISPHYDSPMDDNGYDVRDFYKISPEYGDLDSFRNLIEKAHARGIKVITDLVLNHTSDENPWFLAAKDPNHPEHGAYHDYYIWHKPKMGPDGKRMMPTRWLSWFGGPVWEYNKATDEYYLHIFSKKMPDLNWRNPEVHKEMKRVVRFWIGMGVDGFRVDASNHLEKNWDFPDTYPGYENFSSLPKHHAYLKELGREIFVPNNLLVIGESGGANQKEALEYVGYNSDEFNLLIHFGACWADVDDHHPRLMGKWAEGRLQTHKIKESFDRWYKMLEGKGWNVIYWHNHDQPRVVSHYGCDNSAYWDKSARMLAMTLYFLPGTAICYQGEEIGMTNVDYDSIEDFRDVEVFTEYKEFLDTGYSPAEALEIIKRRCRDNARTPMQWTSGQNAGFSSGKPWIGVNGNHTRINVESQDKTPGSLLNFYRTILNMRKSDKNIYGGKARFIDIASDDNFIYLNKGGKATHLVIANFTSHEIMIRLKNVDLKGFTPLLKNTPTFKTLKEEMKLSAYDAYVYQKKKG